MDNGLYEKMTNEIADEHQKEREYEKTFPLSRYSTSQLKAELRRRKKEYGNG